MSDLLLPSGGVAPLMIPSLEALLSCDGSLTGIVETAFAHPDVSVDLLSVADLYAVAEWALTIFADEHPEACAFATVCMSYGQAPSDRLCIADATLAYVLDMHLLARHQAESQPRGEADEERIKRLIHYSTLSDEVIDARRN